MAVFKGKQRVLLLFLLSASLSWSQVKRGRNEGTYNIPASNVLGNGNIITGGFISSSIGQSSLRFDPGLFLRVGIADILQLSGKTAMTNFKTLGGTEAHMHVTFPGNDHLRFFGASLSADLYLSTEMDTLSGAAIADRPEYHAYIRPSLTADLDWIALNNDLPLKTYLHLSMADNADLIYLYSQLSIKFGMEWKLSNNSYCIDFGAGLYKELKQLDSHISGDRTYKQQRFWFEPSIRHRLFNRISLLGAARILLLQKVKNERPLTPTYVRISTAVEVPLVYRETNTEAIRSMIFIDKNRQRKTDDIDSSLEHDIPLEQAFPLDVKGLDLDLDSYSKEEEQEVLKQREEIQKKMEEIEKLLEDINDK